MMEKLLSIIVPIYNVELYIEKCISTICDNVQGNEFCELILIDDGSPDNSVSLAEALLGTRKVNYKLITQVNSGLGAARNAGVNIANGKYIWFVDSDDWLTRDSINNIFYYLNQFEPDILNFSYIMSDGSKSTVINNSPADVVIDGLNYLIDSYVQNPVQYYVYSSEFYKKNGLVFRENIYHEDSLFTPIALSLTKRVVKTEKICYVYNLREGSIMSSGNYKKRAIDMCIVMYDLNKFLLENAEKGELFRRSISKYIAYVFGAVFYYWKRVDLASKHKIFERVDHRIILNGIIKSKKYKFLLVMLYMSLFHIVR